MNNIDICTVSFHNGPHLNLNWLLTERINTAPHHCRWLVAENSPSEAYDQLDATDSRFQILRGANPQLLPNYQHTEALHTCLTHATSRFVLILDPDFYLVYPDWIDRVIRYMQDKHLSFFGAPWHSSNIDKYRYFPCVHCLFIDQELLPVDKLDLRPDRPNQAIDKYRTSHQNYTTSNSISHTLWSRLTNAAWRLSGLKGRRHNYCDTGTRFYYKYRTDKSHSFETATPVFRLPEESPVHISSYGRILDSLLPDALCYLPKRRDSYTNTGLRELGYLQHAPKHWEEFMWNGKPFAFHVRRNKRKEDRDAEGEIYTLTQCVDEFSVGR